MGSIDQLRLKHRELHRLAMAIVPLMETERVADESTAIRLNLSTFARKLRVHLLVEDRFIYERLLRHSDPAIVAKATDQQRETHALRDRLARYTRHWTSTEAAIEELDAKFIDETTALLELASKRLDIEERELYPLAEQICNRSGTWPLDLLTQDDEENNLG
jgi:hemerythrin-like domain-containing protein